MEKMLQHWLDNFKNCSWPKIIDALKALDLQKVADDIFTELLTNTFHNQVFETDVIAHNLSVIATKWYEIGDALKLSREKLEKIKSELLIKIKGS